LDVAQWHACVEGGGDERVSQCVRPDSFDDPGLAGDATHDTRRAVTVESGTVAVTQDRAAAAFPDGEIHCSRRAWGEWDGDGLAALAMNDQRPVSAFETEEFDVGPDRFLNS
jgi:hypothetical protein